MAFGSLGLIGCDDEPNGGQSVGGMVAVADASSLQPRRIGIDFSLPAESSDAGAVGGAAAGGQPFLGGASSGGYPIGGQSVAGGGAAGGAPLGGDDDADGVGPCGDEAYVVGEVVLGTTIDGPSLHTPSCGPSNSPERVYRFEVPVDGEVCLSTDGSDFDTILEVRTGACDGPSAACSDDGVEHQACLVSPF